MAHSQRSSTNVPGDWSRERAAESSDESGRSSSSPSRSTSRSELEESGDAQNARSPDQRKLISPRRQPAQRPQSLSLRPPVLPHLKPHTSSVALPLAPSTPTSSSPSALESATSRTPLAGVASPAVLTPSSTEGELPLASADHSAKPRKALPLYVQYKKLVADARREAYEGGAGSRSKRLRPRSYHAPYCFQECPTDYKSKPNRRKKMASGSKRPLTGKQHSKGRQAEWASRTPPAATATAAATPSRTSEVTRSPSKSARSPSAGTEVHAVRVRHEKQPSTTATPATSTRIQPHGGSGEKSAPTHHSTAPRKEPQNEKSRRKEHETGDMQLLRALQLSPSKVMLTRLPSTHMQPAGSLWRSPGSEDAATETTQRDAVTGPPAVGQQGVPMTGRRVKPQRSRPPPKSTVSTGGVVKKRKGHQSLKAAILSTTSTGRVRKKGRALSALKADILSTSSADEVSSAQRNVKCPDQQKTRKKRSPQKNTVLVVPTNIPVTSDLPLCSQRAPKVTPPVPARKTMQKSAVKEKAPSLRKYSSNSVEASKQRRKCTSKIPGKRRRKISVCTSPLKTVSALEPTSQDQRQSASGLIELGEASARRRSKRSAALLAQALVTTAFEEAEDEEAGIKPTKERSSSSPPWKLSTGHRHPICWPPTSNRRRGRGRKARITKRILLQQDDGGHPGSVTSPSMTDDNSVTTVLNHIVQTVVSMDSVLQDMKQNSTEKVECSVLPSATRPLDEPLSSVQEHQKPVCKEDADSSATTATNKPEMTMQNLTIEQTSSTAVEDRKRCQSSLSQPDSDAAVATSPEVTNSGVGTVSGQASEVEQPPRGRRSSLEGVSASSSSYRGLRGRSRSSSTPAAARSHLPSDPTDLGCSSSSNSDRTLPQYGVKHWKKKLMRVPSEQQLRGMLSDEDQEETERSISQSSVSEHSITHIENLPTFHASWTGYESEDSSMAIDLSVPKASSKLSVPHTTLQGHVNTFADYFSVQGTSMKQCERAGDNLSVGRKGAEPFPSWSLKFDTSLSGGEVGIQGNSGEWFTATKRSESSVMETPHRVHADTTSGDACSPPKIPLE